jgi:general secretion pathway protein E
MDGKDNHEIENFTELDQFMIDENSVKLLDYNFCVQKYVVILGTVDPNDTDRITIGMPNPKDTELIEQLENILERSINPVRLNAYEIQKALDIAHGQYEPSEDGLKTTLTHVNEISFDPEISVAEMLDELIGRAVTLGASDIHIECYKDDIDLRFRVDGILHQITTPLHMDNIASVISRLKILSDLDIAERRLAQDGRFYATFEIEDQSRLVDFRVSIVPGLFGEDAVLRILDSKKPLIGLDEMGFSHRALTHLRELINNPEGMILVTGPTGSGKTTTLYAVLQEVNTEQNKVLTAEDPVEYLFPKINQKQVDGCMNFADYARAFLRQDPDIIMIGEIRDEETAEIALRAAQTGHLMFSTLHTNDSVGTVSRLRVLGIKAGMLADSLLGALSQRLVRKICKKCKAVSKKDRFAESIFKRIGYRFEAYCGTGCSVCTHTEYKGRIGLFELFAVDQEIADMIAADLPSNKIRRSAREKGMTTLFDDALDKVRAGKTSFSELRRAVPYRIIIEPVIKRKKKNRY